MKKYGPVYTKLQHSKTTFIRLFRFVLLISLVFTFLLAKYSLAQNIQRIEIPSSFNPVGSGARSLGMGGAFISTADDATAASWNPGALIQLRKPEFAIVGSTFRRDEENHFGTNPEASGVEEVTNNNFNYLSASVPCRAERCGRNMVFSLNYQNLFNFDRHWNFNFIEESETYNSHSFLDYRQEGDLYALGLAYAVQATEQLSFGVTLNFWEDFIFDNEWMQTYQDDETGIDRGDLFTFRADTKIRNQFSGFNLNLGIWWEAYQKEEKKLTIGAVLKTPFTAKVKTRTEQITRVSYPDSPSSNYSNIGVTTENSTIKMPMSYGIGVSYQFSDNFTLAADIYRTEWNDFVQTDMEGEQFSPISHLPINDSDIDPTTQVRIGAEYRVINQEFGSNYIIPLRAGLFYDPAPAEDSPDDIYGFSLGGGIVFENFVFDIAYQYRFGNDIGKSVLSNLDYAQDLREHTTYLSVFYRF